MLTLINFNYSMYILYTLVHTYIQNTHTYICTLYTLCRILWCSVVWCDLTSCVDTCFASEVWCWSDLIANFLE